MSGQQDASGGAQSHQGSLKKGVTAVHGAGEVLRGSLNVMADKALGHHQPGDKNEQVLRKGLDEMNQGRPPPNRSGGGGGAAAASTSTGASNLGNENPNSTNHGPHSSAAANKLDPTVDSDRDGRSAVNNPNSGNFGPHSGAAGNKLDPGVDSDHDNRGARATNTGAAVNSQHGNTQSTAQNSAQNNPNSGNFGPHSSSAANRLDPSVDSDLDNRGSGSMNASVPGQSATQQQHHPQHHHHHHQQQQQQQQQQQHAHHHHQSHDPQFEGHSTGSNDNANSTTGNTQGNSVPGNNPPMTGAQTHDYPPSASNVNAPGPR